jgi:DNA-binding CsgD family transcriptional regulator
MTINPFTYGNPISDARRFVGRESQVDQVFSRLRNVEFESSSLVGERRIGKTSLLYHIADPQVRRSHGLPPDEYFFVYVDLALIDATTTPTRLWQYLLRQMMPHLSPADAEWLHAVLADANALDNFTLAEVFDRLDAQRRHVVLLLDEFENVTRNENFSPDFFYSLRSLAIHHRLALITSSRRELIELTHSNEIRSSPFFNIFANINVRLLSREDAHALIVNALSETGVQFSEAELETIVRVAGPHPFFLQTASHFMFQAYVSRVNAALRQAYWMDRFSAEARPHLSEYWRHCEEREKIVLAALACLQENRTRITTAQVEEFLGRSERVIAQLDKHALVIPQGDGFVPFSALFGELIREALAEETFAREFETAVRANGAQPDTLVEATGLSPREIQVLRLVATGMSDAQVASKLVVSPRTVSTHLQSIYNKLGVNSRAAATRFAVENGLVEWGDR